MCVFEKCVLWKTKCLLVIRQEKKTETKVLFETMSEGIGNITQMITDNQKKLFSKNVFCFSLEVERILFHNISLAFYIIIVSYSYWLLKYIIDH
jgi:hypothetical protein